VVICLERGADSLRMVQVMPLPSKNPVIFSPISFQNGLPFWYRLTKVVLEKRPLYRCSNTCSSSNHCQLKMSLFCNFLMVCEMPHESLCVLCEVVAVRGCCVDEYYMSSVRQIDTLLTAATQSILLQITWSEAFKVCGAIVRPVISHC